MKLKGFRTETFDRNRIIVKTFLKNLKNYFVFFSSYLLSVTIIFTFLGVRNMLTQFGNEDFYVSIYGTGKIITDGLKVMAVITVFLMVFAVKYYVMTRAKDYEIYKIMGMRQSLIKKLLALEYTGTILGAFLGGFLLGNIFTFLCKIVFKRLYFENSHLPSPGGYTYLLTVLICILVFFVSFAINNELAVETHMINTTAGVEKKEQRPKKRSRVLFPLGIILSAAGILLYSRTRCAEGIGYLALFLIGMTLVLYYGGSLVLDHKRKKEGHYYRRLLNNHHFYHQFKSHMNYMILLFGLQFFILFYYPVQLLTNIPADTTEDAYPYEFVWKMDKNDREEDELLTQIQQVPGAECTKIPAVAVTVPSGNKEASSQYAAYSQGQNIGIPQSAYKKLTGRSLKLKENEIYVILQQGKERAVHPLDFFGITSTYLHFGPAYPAINMVEDQDYFTDYYQVKGIERGYTIGEFDRGNNENLVIFSDQVFEELDQITDLEELLSFKINRNETTDYYYHMPAIQGYVEKAGYLNQLVLINVPKENAGRVDELLRDKYVQQDGGGQIYDSNIQNYYARPEAREKLISERIFHNVIYGILLGVFIFTELFVIFVKMVSESGRINQDEKFYRIMGMRSRDRNRAVYGKFRVLFVVPFAAALLFGGIFTAVTLHLRAFTITEIKAFLGKDILLAGGFMLSQMILYYLMKRRFLIANPPR